MVRLVLFLLAITLLWHCTMTQIPSNKPRNKNFIYLYAPENGLPYPHIKFFNEDRKNTTLYLRFQKQSLDFFHNQDPETKECQLEIIAKVIPSFRNQLLLDSTGTLVRFVEDTGKIFYETSLSLYTPKQYEHYVVTLTIRNLITQKTFYNFYLLDKHNDNTRSSFLAVDSIGNILYTNYTSTGHSFRFFHSQKDSSSTLYISYLPHFAQAGEIPYSLNLYKPPVFNPDTIYKTTFQKLIAFNKPGIYFLQTDTLSANGYMLSVFDSPFPLLKRPIDLLLPLYYLTSLKEYKTLLSSAQPKTTLDAFWLQTAQSPARAQLLIQAYYNRVLLSNLLFTTYKEGWKTDRGMIYIIFGRPKYVFRSENLEKWIYGDPSTSASLSFLFERRSGKLYPNCKILDRQDSYEEPWNQAIRIWREGHVYSIF